MVWPQSKAIRSSSSSSSEHFNILFCTSLDFMKVIKDFVKYGKVLQRLLKNISGSSFYLSFFFLMIVSIYKREVTGFKISLYP